MKLKRKDLIDCCSSYMWREDLTKEEVIEILNKYIELINKYDYAFDNDFIMDSRRLYEIERINYLTSKPFEEAIQGVDNMMHSFWEFISEEYCGTAYEEMEERGLSRDEVNNIWNRYKEKGIICLQEKEKILDMINVIKNYINKDSI